MKTVKRTLGRGRLAAAFLPAAVGFLSLLAHPTAAVTAAHAQVSVFEEPGENAPQSYAADQDVYLHTVQWPGESLTLIAAWYTGDPGNWTLLAAVNGGADTDAVRPNEVILIPKALLTTETPMPRVFVDFYTQRDTGRLPPKTPPPARRSPKASPRREYRARPAPQPDPPAGPLELFGPKD